jgi:membrane protease YdiL (CAAX protease family)
LAEFIMSKTKQNLLLAAPPLLLASCAAVYFLLGKWLGPVSGYLGGFLFYWILWCILLPLWLLGSGGIKDLFQDKKPRFGNPAWLGMLFLLGPFVTPFFAMFLPKVSSVTTPILIVSVFFAVFNGTLEEVLWRGAFLRAFPDDQLRGYWYPAVGFGYWHLAPQVIFPSTMPGGAFAFATMSIFMGLVYGWVVRQSGSLRWVTISHILTDLMGLAGLAFLGGGYGS